MPFLQQSCSAGSKFWHTSKIIRAISETEYLKLQRLRHPSDQASSGNRGSPVIQVLASDSDSDDVRTARQRKRPRTAVPCPPELSDSDSASQLLSAKYQATFDVRSLLLDIKDNVFKFRKDMKELRNKEQTVLSSMFTCIICQQVSHRGKIPLIPKCCSNIVCCQHCLSEWLSASTQCPHCRQTLTIADCTPQPILRPLFDLLDKDLDAGDSP